jgi:hypothetical protein
MSKNLGGAPSKYRGAETLSMMNTYLETYEEEGQVLPTIAAFSRFVKVNKDTLYEWEKKHSEFKEAMDDLRAAQETALINNGLAGTYNSTITKLILSKHGYSDKQEISGPEGQPVQVETWELVGVKSKDGNQGPDTGQTS